MKIYKLIIPIVLIAIISGCQDVLNKRNLNAVEDEVIWEDEVQAILYINNLYGENMPGMSMGSNSFMSDEFYSSAESSTDLMYGFAGPINNDVIKVLHRERYQEIRTINIGIRGLENSSMSNEVVAPIKAQALFFRAYRYWEMVKLYGGIPMIMYPQDPYNEDVNVARSKTSESINLIIADLDQAIADLPISWELSSDKGRITSGAAAAFKARILLAWASPLFNTENKSLRWDNAYNASTSAVEILSQMDVPRDLHSNFSTIFTTDVLNNVEAVIYKRYDLEAGTSYTSGWEGSARPPSTGGNGGYNPTWEMVKAFPMANGKLITDEDSGYDSTYFWQNRDPRLEATIAYHGCDWDMQGREDGQKQWSHARNIHELNRIPATSFWNRKATDPTIAVADVGQTNTTWHELRYAEVLLNLAECANEVGNTSEAVVLVRRIRERAGIENIDGTFGIADGLSKDQLREMIMIERQVEFAFENKRYWDLRRRLMFRNDLGENVKKINGTQRHGFKITAQSKWLRRVNVPQDSPFYGWNHIDTITYLGHVDINDVDNYNTYFETEYKVMESTVNSVSQLINYLPLYDYFGVSTSFLEKSPAVQQTIGWMNGTFDPLEE